MAFLNDPKDTPAKVLAQPPAPPVFSTHTELVAEVTALRAELNLLRAEYDAHSAANPKDPNTTATWGGSVWTSTNSPWTGTAVSSPF